MPLALPPTSPPHRPAVAALDNERIRTIHRLVQQRGQRLTSARLRVLHILAGAEGPLKAYAVLDEIRRTLPGTGPTAVYRAMEFLQFHGWAVKLNSINAYLFLPPGTPGNCTFLVCDTCTSVAMLRSAPLEPGWVAASRHLGFVPATHAVEISGRCAQCVSQRAAGGDPR